MRRSIALASLLAIGTVLAISSWLPANDVASAGQGKGGEVIAKPTPTPKKTTTTKRNTPAKTTGNSKTSRPAKSTSDSATAAEMIFWNSIKDSTNPDDFKEYLKKYPNGEFAGLAANRLKTLEAAKSSTNPTSTKPSSGPSPTNPSTTNSTSGGSTNPASTTTGPNSATPKTAMPPNPPLPLHTFDFVTVTLDSSGKLKSRETKSANAYTEDLGSGVKLEMVAIPPGEFMMGSPETEYGRDEDESPQHRVRINYWFYMGRFEVTQAQWRAVMGSNPSDCDECPVEQVSWNDATEFCQKLSARMGREYRLPSEAEWEYAARAGTTTPFAFGDTIMPEIVNYDGDHPYGKTAKGTNRRKSVPAGSLGVANAFALYDMHGNVSEWCQDWHHGSYDAIAGGAPTDGSAWLSGGEQKYRIFRGGSWSGPASKSRSAYRGGNTPDFHGFYYGFRVVAVARTQ